MKAYLERFADTPFGVFGVMTIGAFQCYTLEPPAMGNEPWKSCIPAGNYRLAKDRFNAGGYDSYEFLNVPNRDDIMIHIGNTQEDTVGCIMLGLGLGFYRGKWAVLSSTKAHAAFMDAMAGDRFALIEITWKKADDGRTGQL